MGKSWKSRAHTQTGYPYNPIRAAHHLNIMRPKGRQEDEENLFLGIYSEGHPVFSKAEFKAAGPDLKHLDFLRTYCQYYSTKLAHAYSSSRAFLPAPCIAGLNAIETRVTSVGAPLFSGIQTGSERALWTLDSKVDAVVRAAQGALHPRSGQALAFGSEAEEKQAYLQRLEESVQFLRENGVAGTARHAVGLVLRQLDEIQKLPSGPDGQELPLALPWGKLAAFPPVNILLEKAHPSVEYTQRKYADAHDAVVSSAIYNRAVETAADVLQRVMETSLFKTAAERLYPAISNVADPALEKIVSSAYTQALIEHLKPIPREERKGTAPILSCVPC